MLSKNATGEAQGTKLENHPTPARHHPRPSQAPALPTPGFIPSPLQALLELDDE